MEGLVNEVTKLSDKACTNIDFFVTCFVGCFLEGNPNWQEIKMALWEVTTEIIGFIGKGR